MIYYTCKCAKWDTLEVRAIKEPMLFLLDGLSADEMERCIAIGVGETLSFHKGEVLYDADHVKRALAVVVHGHVRVMYGRVVMNDLHSGEVFGAAALYGSDEAYPSTVVAVTDGCVRLIPQEIVSRWMAEVPRVAENYVRFLSDRIRFLNRRLSTLTVGSADGRLWKYLCTHRDESNTVRVDGGMSALAERLDMGRSSLYRSLDALTYAGRIRRDGKIIYLLDMEE